MRLFVAAAIVLIGSASLAPADESGRTPERTTPSRNDPLPPAPSIFDELDTNRDGRLSESEASRMQGMDLRKLDTDHNGAIDRGEWKKGADAARQRASAPRASGSFDALDTDRDGSISKTEAAPVFDSAAFSKLDKNGNGVIDRSEYGPLARRPGSSQPPAAPSGGQR